MQATRAKWTMDSEGAWLCLLTSMDDAREVCSSFEPGKTYDVTVKEHRNKRSLDANAYFWVLLDKLACKMRASKTDLYRSYIREIGGNSDTVCLQNKAVDKLVEAWGRNGLGWQTDTMPSKLNGCTNVILYYGSSTYDTAQMSRLIDMVVQDCKSVGIETMQQDKLNALLSSWEG